MKPEEHNTSPEKARPQTLVEGEGTGFDRRITIVTPHDGPAASSAPPQHSGVPPTPGAQYQR